MINICGMPLEHFSRLDLNLLVALDALLAEANVTRAGKRLGLTQPAMSRTLARLRAHFGDALLVRSGRALVPTPRAERLRQPLRDALLGLESAVSEPPQFDPTTARRTFTLATADYGVAVCIPRVLGVFAKSAPGIDLTISSQRADWDEALREGSLDLALFPKRASTPGIVWTSLFAETFSCLVRRANPFIRGSLSLEQFCAVPHVFVSPAGSARSVVDDALAQRQRSRRIALRLESFLAAPLAVAQSDLLAVVPTRIAREFAAKLDLRSFALPLAVPGFSLSVAWHERMRHDDGHRWLRRQLVTLLTTDE